jgi:hypothetical protein
VWFLACNCCWSPLSSSLLLLLLLLLLRDLLWLLPSLLLLLLLLLSDLLWLLPPLLLWLVTGTAASRTPGYRAASSAAKDATCSLL